MYFLWQPQNSKQYQNPEARNAKGKESQLELQNSTEEAAK